MGQEILGWRPRPQRPERLGAYPLGQWRHAGDPRIGARSDQRQGLSCRAMAMGAAARAIDEVFSEQDIREEE